MLVVEKVARGVSAKNSSKGERSHGPFWQKTSSSVKHRTQYTSVNKNQPPSLLIDFDYMKSRAHFLKVNFNLPNYNFSSAAQLPTDEPKYRNHCRFYHFKGQGLILSYHVILLQHPLRKQDVL
jgi:hypothetical protein